MSSGQPWTREEDQTLFSMKAAGKEYQQIADALHRTWRSVQGRLRYHETPWAQRAEENRQKKASRKPRPRIDVLPKVKSGYVRDIPIEVLIDRDRRLLAERSLTAMFFGDPEPGRARL